ncbi:hypothetical protein QR46_4626 [Giardia duodenalis assemblage B]|uniref:Uncharacterized protein n=1 Tax=Giardia duodenalis assemblage B TaxID=1394984 RepID=A0A132NMV4_GIAIN|nr:hypothetical protein QR46_4626 [Giardia intestinalis assemblage B]
MSFMSSITVNEATLAELLQKTVKLTISNGSSFIGNVIEVHDIFCVLDNVYRETTSAALEIIPRPVKFNYDLITEMNLIDRSADADRGPLAFSSTSGTGGNRNNLSFQKSSSFDTKGNHAGKDAADDNVEDGEDDLFGDLDLDAERERYKKQAAQRTLLPQVPSQMKLQAPFRMTPEKLFRHLTVQKGSRRTMVGNRPQDSRRNDGNGSFTRTHDNRGDRNEGSRKRGDQHKTYDNDGGYRSRNRNRHQAPFQADSDYRPRNTGNRPSGRFNNVT